MTVFQVIKSESFKTSAVIIRQKSALDENNVYVRWALETDVCVCVCVFVCVTVELVLVNTTTHIHTTADNEKNLCAYVLVYHFYVTKLCHWWLNRG